MPDPQIVLTPKRSGVGRNVVLLGGVSLLTDVSSEMVYPLLPLFLTGTLAAPATVVGLVEGLAEGLSSLVKLASGQASDRARRRLPFLFVGYGVSALSKPALALAGTWPIVLAARLSDRTGKGIRGPARDALIAASTPAANRGQAFGLHRAMDTVGAMIGPLAAWGLIELAGSTHRQVFALAAIPALMSVALLTRVRDAARFRRAPDQGSAAAATQSADRNERATTMPPARISGLAQMRSMDPQLRRFLGVMALFSIGNSSNAFVLLRAAQLGWSDSAIIVLYAVYNATYALGATPLGRLSDRIGRRPVLAAAMAVFALTYAGLALAPSGDWIAPLFVLLGIHAALLGGSARALVTDLADPARMGAAMGAYQATLGILLPLASLLAGVLWQNVGAAATFAFGAATATLATAAVLRLETRAETAAP